MTTLGKWKAARFVAWDSEGCDIRGEHELILVANSNGNTLSRGGRALGSVDVLNWLVDGLTGKLRENKLQPYRNATHVIFAGSYDANMWLRDLPHRHLQELWVKGVAYWHLGSVTYRLEYRPRKYFMVHRYRDGLKEGGCIWDVIGFYQSTFVAACKENGLGEQLEEIERMKAARDQFTAAELPEITAYCLRECKLLVGLCERLHSDIAAAELAISRWDGAGALASELLRSKDMGEYMGVLPPKVDHFARFAYFGGRIELIRFGRTTDKIWKYDINSAYPAAATEMPCLAHGHWSQTKHYDPSAFGVWDITATTPFNDANIGAFPFRAKDARVYFPWQVRGRYWTPEVNAALAVGAEVDVRQGFIWTPDCDHKPFQWIPKLYRYRQQLKQYGGAGQKAIKLALNSVYGKLAQRAGGEKRIPRWHNLAWAGWITSYTRANLFRYAYEAGSDLIALATDAVFVSREMPSIPTSSKLGEWESDEYPGMTALQSGVYWLGENRFTPDARRGFDARSLDLASVLDGWQMNAESVRVYMRAFVGMGLGMRDDFVTWRQWVDIKKDIRLWPDGTKRTLAIPRANARPWERMEMTVPTDPYLHGVEMSHPTDRPWDKLAKTPDPEIIIEPPEMCEALEWQV